MIFDALIIGGGVAGVSCAMILGSAHKKPFMSEKKIAIFTHQKSTNLQEALFNNAYGIAAGKLGSDLMHETLQQLGDTYPQITQIPNEKVLKVENLETHLVVHTNKNSYQTKIIVVATNASNTFNIEGLNQYVTPHLKSIPEKNRIQLANQDHLVTKGIYVAGTLAGWRSQLAIASGSGAMVATDILTLWNNGIQTQAHDSIKK